MTVRVLTGDCRDVLPTLPEGSVQCVVTSPPYYGLRDYGTAQWEGGDAGCEHKQPRNVGASTLKNDGRPIIGIQPHEEYAQIGVPFRAVCGKCGARRIDSQIGLEATPEEWLATMVAVFREIRRVIRDDAVAFVNVGDSYQDKQLLMMPARLALALQADGWFIRSDIIWAKPNPMPESVTDRPTNAHEHVFLLTKSARYVYDADAVREPLQESTLERCYSPAYLAGIPAQKMANAPDDVRAKANWRANAYVPAGRNLRNVWTIATAPFPEAHFATFPPELAERCIRAGTKHGDTVLDPFAGAGTTCLVADRLQRHAIGIELNATYAAMAHNRVNRDAPLLVQCELQLAPPASPPLPIVAIRS